MTSQSAAQLHLHLVAWGKNGGAEGGRTRRDSEVRRRRGEKTKAEACCISDTITSSSANEGSGGNFAVAEQKSNASKGLGYVLLGLPRLARLSWGQGLGQKEEKGPESTGKRRQSQGSTRWHSRCPAGERWLAVAQELARRHGNHLPTFAKHVDTCGTFSLSHETGDGDCDDARMTGAAKSRAVRLARMCPGTRRESYQARLSALFPHCHILIGLLDLSGEPRDHKPRATRANAIGSQLDDTALFENALWRACATQESGV